MTRAGHQTLAKSVLVHNQQSRSLLWGGQVVTFYCVINCFLFSSHPFGLCSRNAMPQRRNRHVAPQNSSGSSFYPDCEPSCLVKCGVFGACIAPKSVCACLEWQEVSQTWVGLLSKITRCKSSFHLINPSFAANFPLGSINFSLRFQLEKNNAPPITKCLSPFAWAMHTEFKNVVVRVILGGRGRDFQRGKQKNFPNPSAAHLVKNFKDSFVLIYPSVLHNSTFVNFFIPPLYSTP